LAKDYYTSDIEVQAIDVDLIKSRLEREFPRQADLLAIALDKIEQMENVSVNNIVSEFIAEKRHAISHDLAGHLLAGKECEGLMEEYQMLGVGKLQAEDEEVTAFTAPQYADIVEAIAPENLIELYPAELNERIGGGALRGHHILVFARPETGKSLFMINMVRGFLEQELKVLYIGNEDNEKAMLPRVFYSVLDVTKEEYLELDEDEVNQGLNNAGIENFTFIHLEPGTFQQIRGLIGVYAPDVVIVDQIRNVETGGDGLTTSLERAGTEMRNIGNEFDVLAISITQAGESASGKLVLGLSDIDSSKTGLPAQLDLMIGIGITEDYDNRSKRMISLSKNKLNGNHAYFSVTVDEQKSRVL